VAHLTHRIGAVLGLLLAVPAVPASAQIDLSGEWSSFFHEEQPERIPGPEIGNYIGFPVNDHIRMRGDTWDASIQTLPEYQCRPHNSDYQTRAPQDLHIEKEIDLISRDVVAWKGHWLRSTTPRVFYMDGRPRPSPNDLHTWEGFSTAEWHGDVLTITTTHLKEGYIRRNGLPRSDKATVVEHLVRHGDVLTWVTIIDDPVYLTEPLVRSTDYRLNLHGAVPPYPCGIVEEVDREPGNVPHFLPGTNPFLTEFAERYGVPAAAWRGGAETMYPEYRLKLQELQGPNPSLREPVNVRR
jgi:hypothetical protein